MPRLAFSPAALQQMGELPREKVLLGAVWRHLEMAADDPDSFTEPAPFPHRKDRWLFDFRASDISRNEYAFSVLFARDFDKNEMTVTFFSFNSTRDYPDSTSDFQAED